MNSMHYRVYMDYNATTPLEPEVIQAISEALQDAWGNPSSSYIAGEKLNPALKINLMELEICSSANIFSEFHNSASLLVPN